jgi:hypothetical protein
MGDATGIQQAHSATTGGCGPTAVHPVSVYQGSTCFCLVVAGDAGTGRVWRCRTGASELFGNQRHVDIVPSDVLNEAFVVLQRLRQRVYRSRRWCETWLRLIRWKTAK